MPAPQRHMDLPLNGNTHPNQRLILPLGPYARRPEPHDLRRLLLPLPDPRARYQRPMGNLRNVPAEDLHNVFVQPVGAEPRGLRVGDLSEWGGGDGVGADCEGEELGEV